MPQLNSNSVLVPDCRPPSQVLTNSLRSCSFPRSNRILYRSQCEAMRWALKLLYSELKTSLTTARACHHNRSQTLPHYVSVSTLPHLPALLQNLGGGGADRRPNGSRAGATSTADTVLAVALFEIRPYLAFANLLWTGPAEDQHLFVMGQSSQCLQLT